MGHLNDDNKNWQIDEKATEAEKIEKSLKIYKKKL